MLDNYLQQNKSDVFCELVDLIGYEKAALLSKHFGGRHVYVAKTMGPHSPLVAALGLEAAEKISHSYGGEDIHIPLSVGKRLLVIDLLNKGESIPVIAGKLYCSESFVYKVQRENKSLIKKSPHENQISLF